MGKACGMNGVKDTCIKHFGRDTLKKYVTIKAGAYMSDSNSNTYLMLRTQDGKARTGLEQVAGSCEEVNKLHKIGTTFD